MRLFRCHRPGRGPSHGRATAQVVVAVAWAVCCACPAFAIQTCDLDGAPVNPANGATTAGRTGLMRCRDADSGVVQREQALKNGVFMGVERFFDKGELVKERHVDERGNGDGVAREWAVAGGKRILVREETQKNGRTVGLARTWAATGAERGRLRRLTWYGDDGREQAFVEFADDGRPSGLQCGARPLFGADFDDRTACGFAGAKTTELVDGRGRPASRVTFDAGRRVRTETLAESGTVRELRETTSTGAIERTFWPDGTKHHDVQYANLATPPNPSRVESPRAVPPRVKTLEQDYAESGRLVRERRWTPTADGADLAADNTWYLNGQPKTETRIVSGPQGQVRREHAYFDDGTLAFEGDWVASTGGASRYERRERPVGTHRTYAAGGRKRGESVYDDRGRLTRERVFDETGAVVRDEDVFEDGSRKAVGR